MDPTKIVFGVAGIAAVLIITSRNLSSFWTTVYRLVVGIVAAGACYLVLDRIGIDISDDARLIASIVVGGLASLAASGIPWL